MKLENSNIENEEYDVKQRDERKWKKNGKFSDTVRLVHKWKF